MGQCVDCRHWGNRYDVGHPHRTCQVVSARSEHDATLVVDDVYIIDNGRSQAAVLATSCRFGCTLFVPIHLGNAT